MPAIPSDNVVLLSLGVSNTATDGSNNGSIGVWTVVVIAATIVGLFAALDQFATRVTGRRRRFAQDRLLDALADEHDAEVTERRLHDLKQLATIMEAQIADEIPRLARRNYLEQQRSHLARSLRTSYSELKLIESELGELGDQSELHVAVRQAIEDRLTQVGTLGPSSEIRLIRWIVIGTALLVFLPYFVPTDYSGFWGFNFDWLLSSFNHYPSTVVTNSIIWSLLGGATVLGIARSRIGRRVVRVVGTQRELQVGLLLLSVGVAFFAVSAWYAHAEDSASMEDRSKGVPEFVLIDDPEAGNTPEGVPIPHIRVDNPDFDRERYYYDNVGVARLLVGGIAASSLGIGISLDALLKLRRASPKPVSD